MTRKISTELTGPLILSLADPLASGGLDDPLIITSDGSIVSGGPADTSTGTNAITGPGGTDWIIRNDGLISSANGWGIDLVGGGIIGNAGLIEGGDNYTSSGGITAGSFTSISNTGTIDGMNDSNAIDLNGAGGVANSGTIFAHGSYGIEIFGGGIIRNFKGGWIFGDNGAAIDVASGLGVVTNQGTISGGFAIPIFLEGGGSLANLKGGWIFGSKGGILISGGVGEVTNAGTISGYDDGVILSAGGIVTNMAGAQMMSVEIDGGFGTVANQGSLSAYAGAGDPAILLTKGGLVMNRGQIIGSPIYSGACIDITGGPGTVVNAGTISGSATSVLFGDGDVANRVVLEPGAAFTGAVVAAGGTGNTIELAKGEGTLGSIGYGSFNGFDTLVADAGADWTLGGDNTIGRVLVTGVLDITSALTVSEGVATASTGLFQLGAGASLYVQADAGTRSAIAFAPRSQLVIENFPAFGRDAGTATYAGPLLMDFAGAEIDLKGFSVYDLTDSFSAGKGLLQLSDGAHAATLEFEISSLGAGSFHFAGDGAGGLSITLAR